MYMFGIVLTFAFAGGNTWFALKDVLGAANAFNAGAAVCVFGIGIAAGNEELTQFSLSA